MMSWSFFGVTRHTPDPAALTAFYERLPWGLPLLIAQGDDPADCTLELRSGDDSEPGLLRDPEGHRLRVLAGTAPAAPPAAPAWFEGISFFTPRGAELYAFYTGLPGAAEEVSGSGEVLVGIVRLGLARVAVMQTPAPRWHLECGLTGNDHLATLRDAGFQLGATRHRPWGETATSLKDPEGVEIEFEVDDAPPDAGTR